MTCPACRAAFSPEAFLDGAGGVFPSHRVVLWTCPSCSLPEAARLEDGRLEWGQFDAVPGPRFEGRQVQEGLPWTVAWGAEGPRVRLPGGEWLLGARPSDWLPELRIVPGRIPPRPVDEAVLDEAAHRLGHPLPPSYRAFARRYGGGWAMNALRVLAPEELRPLEEESGRTLFAEGMDGQRLCWDVSLNAGRGELWIDLIAGGARRAGLCASLGALLMLAVANDEGEADPLQLGDRFTDLIFSTDA